MPPKYLKSDEKVILNLTLVSQNNLTDLKGPKGKYNLHYDLFSDIHLLDAGCGTGHYAKPLVEMGLGKITLLDASPEMLDVAKEKLNGAIRNGTVDIVEATLPGFPFKERVFDAVMFNLLLNHLDDPSDNQLFPTLQRTLDDAHRILKPDGVLIISTVLPTTVRESIWFFQLHHKIKEEHARSLLSVNQFSEMFEKHGFQCVSGINLLTTSNANIFHDYLNPESPLKEEWCQALHLYDLATDSEIKEMKTTILDLKRNDKLLNFVKEADHTHERGLLTVFVCKCITKSE